MNEGHTFPKREPHWHQKWHFFYNKKTKQHSFSFLNKCDLFDRSWFLRSITSFIWRIQWQLFHKRFYWLFFLLLSKCTENCSFFNSCKIVSISFLHKLFHSFEYSDLVFFLFLLQYLFRVEFQIFNKFFLIVSLLLLLFICFNSTINMGKQIAWYRSPVAWRPYFIKLK